MARWFSSAFYKSTAWIKCRDAYIKSVYGLCERCGKPGYIVHHKIYLNEKNINDPNITLNWDNLEYVCFECHNKEHEFGRAKKSYTRKGLKFNENGELISYE
jgi:5-methylcytosine-specific restriction endonuclease McrA